MVESDQAEIKMDEKQADAEKCVEAGLKNKRPRTESSEDESLEMRAKKHCNSDKEHSRDIHNCELNGKDVNNDAIYVGGDKSDAKNEIVQEEDKKNAEQKGEELDKSNGVKEPDEEEKEATELVDKGASLKDEKEIFDQEMQDDDKIGKDEDSEEDQSSKKKVKTTRDNSPEVVEGLELSVECASEKESSSSESKEEEPAKPKPKTTIVKAKPTDSEFEMGSSEGDKSEEEKASRSLEKQTGKKGKKGGKKSFSKPKNTSSDESMDSDRSDDDYSPRTKKKLKKSGGGKKAAPSGESKRGRSRGRKQAPKKEEKEEYKEDSADESNDGQRNKRSEEQGSEHSDSKSDSDSKNESNNESNSKAKRSGSGDMRKVDSLKKYIRAAGIRVKSYSELFATCKSNASKVRRLKDLLEKNGITGRPTLEKCKRMKLKNETLRDISELSKDNIISEARVTRAQRNSESTKGTRSSESPTKRESRQSFKRIMSVVDSDSE